MPSKKPAKKGKPEAAKPEAELTGEELDGVSGGTLAVGQQPGPPTRPSNSSVEMSSWHEATQLGSVVVNRKSC